MLLLDLGEELLPSTRGLEGEFKRELTLRLAKALQQRTQCGWHRNRERPIFSALWGGERDLVLAKIPAFQRQPCFPQPASGMEGNLKGDLHPFRLRFKCLANLPDFLISDFRLFRGLISLQLEAHQRICLGMSKTHSFSHNHRKEFQFHDGGVSPGDLSALFLKSRAPIN